MPAWKALLVIVGVWAAAGAALLLSMWLAANVPHAVVYVTSACVILAISFGIWQSLREK